MPQNLQANKAIFPQGNNVMNYINPIQTPLMPNINPMIQGNPGANYPNMPNNQMGNIGLNPLNPNLVSNPNINSINNNQYAFQMNQNINPQMNPGVNMPKNINQMESGNLSNSNNFSNRQQNQNGNDLLNNIASLLQDINSSKDSAAKDPRKNKKK